MKLWLMAAAEAICLAGRLAISISQSTLRSSISGSSSIRLFAISRTTNLIAAALTGWYGGRLVEFFQLLLY